MNTNTDTTTAAATAATLTLEQRLLAILNSDAAKKRNTPAYLLATCAAALIECEDAGDLPDAAEQMATPEGLHYGIAGKAGGVNVTRDAAGALTVEWTPGYECTWCTVEMLLEAAENGGGIPSWFDEEWIKTDNEDFAGYIIAENRYGNGLIFGWGLTKAAAWENAEEWMPEALDDDAPAGTADPRENIEWYHATAAALHLVRERGQDAAPHLDLTGYGSNDYYRELTDAVREQLERDADRRAEEADAAQCWAQHRADAGLD